MATGRKLYMEVAEEANANSRQLLRDTKKLKKVGSRGHACSLAILSIEESAKAIIYQLASEGVIRIVNKNPNNITTFKKRDLQDHQFKHFLIAGFLADYIQYIPFYAAATGIKKKKLSRTEVQSLIHAAIYAHKRIRIELRPGGKAYNQIQNVFNLLESMNNKKNRGFYVDHTSNRLYCPNDITLKELNEIVILAEDISEMTSLVLSEEIDPNIKLLHIEKMREMVKRIKQIEIQEKRKKSNSKSR